MRLQKSGSLFVIYELLLMLATIEFDYNFLLNTGKIGDVLSDGVLTTKTVAVELFAAQCPPEREFNIGHGAS